MKKTDKIKFILEREKISIDNFIKEYRLPNDFFENDNIDNTDMLSLITCICILLPDVNKNWLLTGNGDVYHDYDKTHTSQNKEAKAQLNDMHRKYAIDVFKKIISNRRWSDVIIDDVNLNEVDKHLNDDDIKLLLTRFIDRGDFDTDFCLYKFNEERDYYTFNVSYFTNRYVIKMRNDVVVNR